MNCPECGKTHHMGYEERGVYDGVIIWVCEEGHAWSRFPDWSRVHAKATEIIARWQKEAEQQ